jgi:hypothetical protein
MGDPSVDAALALARRVAAELIQAPEVEAVALAGSRAGPFAEPGSDLDLYVYGARPPPTERRAAAAAGGTGVELGNAFFELGDEWLDAASGLGMDVMYRTPAWIDEQLDRVLIHHQASVGYSTALWHSVRVSLPLFDRRGWFAALQARARGPYPEPLRAAVVARNQPLLRSKRSSYLEQLARAAARGDATAVNHRKAAFLASTFDLVFAVNRATHPGEKRLLAHVAACCPRRPAGFAALVEALLAAPASSGPGVAEAADALGAAVDRLLVEEGLLPAPDASPAGQGGASQAARP